MFDKIFGRTIIDKHFGHVRVTHDRQSGTFSFYKVIDFGHKKIGFSLENQTLNTNQIQFDLYKLILDNSDSLLTLAENKYIDIYKNSLFKEYDLEFISLNDKDSAWELWFMKKDGFEYCVVDFKNLDIQGLSFQT